MLREKGKGEGEVRKSRRFAQYLLLTIILLVVLLWGAKYGAGLRILGAKTYNQIPYLVFASLFSIVFGIVLAIPHRIKEFSKIGKWTVDWMKLLAIGLPTILLNLSLILIILTPIGKLKYFTYYNPFIEVMITDSRVITLSGVFFGYIIISSLNKRVISNPELVEPSKPADFT
ncbi:MAG TPA: hypothetical protein GX523_18200 [Desulfitobacterium dehalogenans]|uniref:Uncharacterized protein n=1 Tax=Desulfitobacterium dehalogenans TaxID=36854 RepID=A0A7C7D848_9FIRM|nr:hypothetical protein [Desulfitobacterium dehalogenans]